MRNKIGGMKKITKFILMMIKKTLKIKITIKTNVTLVYPLVNLCKITFKF
jgi:hypothetical protein